jgi:hypothetical protein
VRQKSFPLAATRETYRNLGAALAEIRTQIRGDIALIACFASSWKISGDGGGAALAC